MQVGIGCGAPNSKAPQSSHKKIALPTILLRREREEGGGELLYYFVLNKDRNAILIIYSFIFICDYAI